MDRQNQECPPPVSVGDDELAGWSESSLRMALVTFLARCAPRGKGWLSLRLGRLLCRNMRTTIATESGARLAVNPLNLDFFVHIALHGGTHDRDVLEACLRALEPGGVFYDVGANAGLMSTEVAARLGGQVAVVAFEPLPLMARALATTARLNGFADFTVCQVMVGRTPGTATLHVPANSLHASAVPRSRRTRAIDCQVVTLDQLVLDGALPPPTVMKVDVEGGELGVFQGAAETIRRHRPAIVFESDANMDRFGYGRRDLVGLLRSLGDYELHFVSRRGFMPADERLDDMRYSDLIAVPAGRSIDLSPMKQAAERYSYATA